MIDACTRITCERFVVFLFFFLNIHLPIFIPSGCLKQNIFTKRFTFPAVRWMYDSGLMRCIHLPQSCTVVLLRTHEVLEMAPSLRHFRKPQITLVSLPCRCLTQPAGSCRGDSQKVSASCFISDFASPPEPLHLSLL